MNPTVIQEYTKTVIECLGFMSLTLMICLPIVAIGVRLATEIIKGAYNEKERKIGFK